jgi:hypothetical protein
MVGACKDCDRLWREYSEVARAYQQIADQEDSAQTYHQLSERCAAASRAVKHHHASVHRASWGHAAASAAA